MNILKFFLLIGLLSITACSDSTSELNENYGEAKVRERIVAQGTPLAENFLNEVKPIIENRCVVCHACYDAPCQLKLSTPEGIDRGFSPEVVYATRLAETDPTRLFVDAKSTQEWRDKHLGFKPVLNERSQTPVANLDGSVFYKLLAQKQMHPLPNVDVLPDSFDFSLTRTETCPSIETLSDYQDDYPLGGMPYGLPGISSSEFSTLTNWLRQGSPMAQPKAVSESIEQRITQWEAKLNGGSNKSKLIARYIYEHLFLGHLYFSQEPLKEGELPVYFRLVRSTTPSGEPINEIATRRPYDDPGVAQIYYRLRRDTGTVVAKTHIPYALNTERASRWDELFYNKDFSVEFLPTYTDVNPFKVFASLPVDSRYKFLLDEARYFIDGFIKGPVCRGQVALSVIQDKFWVFFVDPDHLPTTEYSNFVYSQADNLDLPSQYSADNIALKTWLTYSKKEKAYIDAKKQALDSSEISESFKGLDTLYKGNENAALTVLRNLDSAIVLNGLHGKNPKTSWVIDYPVFERIHYLLVAGFDIYGSMRHQLITRLYMDFLRIESEMVFITLLPQPIRKPEIESWYIDATDELQSYLGDSNFFFDHVNHIEYKTDDPKKEIYRLLKSRYQESLPLKKKKAFDSLTVTDGVLAQLNHLPNAAIQQLGQVSFILLEEGNGQTKGFTLLRHNTYKNMSSLLFSESNHMVEKDTAEVFEGFIGSYPQVIFNIKVAELKGFVDTFTSVRDEVSYKTLLSRYGVRRAHPDFWMYSDKMHNIHKKNNTLTYGLFDFNRLENR